MRLHPLEERVIVKLISDITSTTIILPSSVKEASLTGTVLAAGPLCKVLKAGDTILFGRYSGFLLPFREDCFRDTKCMNESDVLGIISESEDVAIDAEKRLKFSRILMEMEAD